MEKLSKNNGSVHPHFTGCDVIWISFVICAALGAIITYSTEHFLCTICDAVVCCLIFRVFGSLWRWQQGAVWDCGCSRAASHHLGLKFALKSGKGTEPVD